MGLNRQLCGLTILGGAGRQGLVEEVIVHTPDAGREPARLTKREEAVQNCVLDFVIRRFQEERQELVRLRCTETNPFGLLLARRYEFSFANALVVASGAARRATSAPDGYAFRRASNADARSIARLHEETLNVRVRPEDLDHLLKHADTRVFLAEREQFSVRLALAQAQDGVGRWTVGVRETHRRKGLGLALAQETLQFFAAKKVTPITTYWALDTETARFVRSLDAKTERAYLYFEKRI